MLFAVTSVFAHVVVPPTQPQVGSSNPVSPEPNTIARPTTTPCTVQLFSEVEFNDYGTRPISYTPQTKCAGPWSKVVLTADFTVTKGIQYDRTAKFFLGQTNIYFGTTAEPDPELSPSWHIEKDVTDLSATFKTAQTGYASIQNIVNATYTGIIYASANLLFYPADAANPAPVVPNEVLPLPETFVNTTTDMQTATLSLPRNVERAYLDVIAQSQASDEFWYTCGPTEYVAYLGCGNSAFRQTQISIDGTPAGIAPVYPWIYTGGIDPYLWEPITGIETLNFKPYRVDLTPFAGVLSDGKPHTVSVGVFNAYTGFDLASNLLVYTDPNSSTTSGAITANTLTLTPPEQVQAYVGTAADGTFSGPIDTYNAQTWMISGYVQTSHGRVDTTIQASNTFKNNQSEEVSSSIDQQLIFQETTQEEQTTTTSSTGVVQTTHQIDYPLTVNFKEANDDNNDGGFYLQSYVKQGKYEYLLGPTGAYPTVTNETVENNVQRNYNAAGVDTLSNDNDHSTFASKNSNLNCSYRSLTAANRVLTGVQTSTDCSMAP